MQKGILLEVEGRTGIVLTPSGEFRRVPLPAGHPAVGDEIPVPEAGAWHSFFSWTWVAATAAVLLMLLVPTGYWHWTLAQPAALVMIDINPSIQLTVNGRRQVVAAEGLNADGREVLDAIQWRRQPVEQVAGAIAAQAVAMGKLNPAAEESAVVMAVAPLEGKVLRPSLSQDIVERSRTALHEVVAEQAQSLGDEPRTGVAVVQATAEEVEEARKQDLTLPQLIILEEIQAEHPEVTSDAIRDQAPGKFLKELGINPSELLSRAEQRRSEATAGKGAGKGDGQNAGSGEGSKGNSGPGGKINADKGNPGSNGKSPGKAGTPGNNGKGGPGNSANSGNNGKGGPGNPGTPGNNGKGDEGGQASPGKGNQSNPGTRNQSNAGMGVVEPRGRDALNNPAGSRENDPRQGSENERTQGSQSNSGRGKQSNSDGSIEAIYRSDTSGWGDRDDEQGGRDRQRTGGSRGGGEHTDPARGWPSYWGNAIGY